MYFETLIALLQTYRFLLQVVFLCETDLVIRICQFISATTNSENLQQYKLRFSLITEQVLAFTLHPNIVSDVKNLSPNFSQIV